MYYTIYPSPLGDIALAGTDKGLRPVDFQQSKRPLPIAAEGRSADPPLQAALLPLEHYFAGKEPVFKLSYHLRGTAFQLSVWELLQSIRCGTTLTYTEVAEGIGRSSAVRAVGTAIGRNPISI